MVPPSRYPEIRTDTGSRGGAAYRLLWSGRAAICLGMTCLAVPISAADRDQALGQIMEALAAGAGMIELRTDYLDYLSGDLVAGLVERVRDLRPTGLPLIVTCRDPREGGARPWPQELRLEVLRAALEAGADFVDCEYANFVPAENRRRIEAALVARPASRLILSAHDFTGRFADIRALSREMQQACPAAIVKLVYTAQHINDCFAAFDLLHETSGDRIVLCMGESGLISRILAKKLGGFVTFASLGEHAATAPGQLTAAALRGLYRYDHIDAATELFGVIADPVAHSLSPALHNACFAEKGMNKLYLPLRVQGGQAEFNAFLDNVLARPWLDFRGFSVTIPHKHSALEYVRSHDGFLEPLAEKIGAANTLVVGCQRQAKLAAGRDAGTDMPIGSGRPRGLAAYNTDYAGALDAITAGMGIERAGLRDMPVAVVGAGGVSRAIVAGLTDAGARVTIYNRTVSRAEELAAEFGCQAAGLDALPHLDAKLLINCTSIGMHPHVDAAPVPAECLKPDMVVFDTVYNPAETLLLKQARAQGAKTIDGLTMFVNQAAAQFKLFTSQPADTSLMREVVLGRAS
jgi:3-dehydroquinate dehydratase/shikimate dehydrogenase